ncbi:SUCO-like protein [Mya arenaria]|uniref:SUCO-like protein n=1 Tax=Mya arenaria TaxID=6604 RepID=A0ABY7GFE7_MYAAR|nr:SUCO-like protein [Mya arenaria]
MFIIRLTLVLLCVGRLCCQLVEPDNRGPSEDDAIHPTSASTSHILQTSQHGKETCQGSDQSKTSTETFSDATRQSEVSLTQQVHPKATDDVRSEVKDSQSESESQGQDEVIQDTNTQHQDILLTNGADPVKSDEHVETKQELKEDTPVQADLPDLSEDKSKVAELEGNVHTDHDEVALKKAHLEEPDKKLLEEEPSTEQAETKEDDFADKVKDNEAEEVKEAKLEEVKTTTHTPETPEEAELRGIGGREIKEEDSGEEKGEEVGLTFVLELCEPIQAHSVEVASLELFSSQPKKVKVLLSDRYPTKDWQSAGEFETRDERAVQNFTINKLQDYYAKYVRVEITEHFDTVLGIVKKVLNVEQHEEDSKNVTGTNLADPLSGGQQNISTSTPPAETTTLPCPPDAKIPGELPVTPPTPGDLETQLPQPPEPGKANLVRKLDEDEQIETSTLIPLDTLPGKPLKHHLQKCMETSDKFATKLSTTSSFFNSSLCRFAFIVFQTSPAIKDEENIKVKPLNMSSSQCENGSPKTETKKQSSLSETTKISSSQSTVISVSSKVKDIRETESVPTATSMESSKSETKETTQSKVVEIEPTKISDNLPQSGTTKLSSSTSTTDKNGHIDQTGSSSEQIHIDPSPTSVAIETGSRVDQSIGATPSLPPSWAPETKDVGKETVSTDGNQPHVDTSATGNSYQPDTMTVGIDVQEALTDIKASTVVMTTSDITKPAEVAVENGDMDDIVDDIRHEETSQQPNTIVIDDKVVIDKGTRPSRGDNLDIVRVPIVSSSKRESAIMRLSNRIKVLEQNVSLSSRFLEELSRRYKKQSEDMMKMLNKTMARLTNLTIENDVKNKIHEDEMLVMERRLENLTGVTDRQMIWTTIEIMVIVSMLIFFHLRRQQPASLPPEVKSLIENMPSKPGANPLVRRNSISGPVTPSKKIVDTLQTGASSYDTNDGIGVNPKQVVDGFKKKKKKKHKGSDPKLFYSYGGQPPGELIPESTPEMVQTKSEPARTSSFASIFRNWGSSGTSKPRSGSLGTDDRIGCDTDRLMSASAIEPKENKGTKSKNPQLNVGLKGSASCRLGNRNDNEFVIDDRKPPKGHRRQKSLPKQHYSSIIETVGKQTFAPISNGSQSVSSECNPVSKKAPKKGDLKKSASMPSESAKSRKEPSKSASGQMVNGYHHNGFEEFDNNIQNSHTRTAFGKSHSYTSCVDRGHLKDFGVRENDSVCTPTKYSVDGFVNGYHGDDYDGDVFKSSGSFESCSPRVDLIKGDSDSPSENKRSWKNMFLF